MKCYLTVITRRHIYSPVQIQRTRIPCTAWEC